MIHKLKQISNNNIRNYVFAPLLAPPESQRALIAGEKGGFETDVTITRFSEDSFFMVTAAATLIHDYDYLNRLIPKDARVTITDVTQGYSMLAIMGPKSRELLQTLTDADLSNEAFPYGTAQEIDVAYARPWALRMSYVGELGWELYIPSMFTLPVFDGGSTVRA